MGETVKLGPLFTKNVHKRSRIVKIEFPTAQDRIEKVLENNEKLTGSQSCLAFQIEKDLYQPAGTFRIDLLPTAFLNLRNEKSVLALLEIWLDILLPNDIVKISIWDASERKYIPVMTGLIDKVMETVSILRGKPIRTITVVGRDFGKILITNSVLYVPQAAQVLPPSEFRKYVDKAFFGGTVLYLTWEYTKTGKLGEMIEGILRTFLYPLIEFADGSTLYKWLIFEDWTSDDDVYIIDFTSFGAYNGTFWNFFQQIANPPFYELYVFTDPQDGIPTLRLRRTPWEKKDWNDLLTLEISHEWIRQRYLERSDTDIWTSWSGTLSNDIMQDIWLSVPPEFHDGFLKRFGFRWMQIKTPLIREWNKDYVYFREEPVRRWAREWTKKLYEFYKFAPYFMRGNYVLVGTPKPRIGMRAVTEDTLIGGAKEFYITKVSHSWTLGGPYETTITVDRGLKITDKNKIEQEIQDTKISPSEPIDLIWPSRRRFVEE